MIGVDRIELLILAVGALVVALPLASKLGLPYPVLLTLVGVTAALIPGVPEIEINPNFVLPFLLPPLLWAASTRTSWAHIRANLRPILTLAVALVAVSAFAVAAVLSSLLPQVPWAIAFALGAACAPPDPVAATSVAGQLGLPHRMVAVIEGEGLGNDATALTLFNTALAAAAVGGTISLGSAGREFLAASVLGIGMGLLLALVAGKILDWLTDPVLAGAFTVVLPFAAYAAGEEIGGSGVLAVLAMGLVLGGAFYHVQDAESRLVGSAFWATLDLLLTSIAFILIGLELRPIIEDAGSDIWRQILIGLGVAAVLILVRMVWLVASGLFAHRFLRSTVPGDWREAVILGWAGMRGVVTIAAALSLPAATPERGTLILIAFVVVMVTLILPGITLPWLVKRVGVATADPERATREIAVRVVGAMNERITELHADGDLDDEGAERWRQRVRRIVAMVSPNPETESLVEERAQFRHMRAVNLELHAAAQAEALRLRADEGIDPAADDRILRIIDRQIATT
ncbi:sodium:proton antiporter [Hamadaea sp.]|uniref:cation:proton antiporter n=1 Tax=Hamadaea sp. TaxID=2024425 RepID=UPI0025C11521|nr:sodium:proton antiporter [Hamadaea sp.]